MSLAPSGSDSDGGPDRVNYATSDGTAVAGSDYTAASGTLHVYPGRSPSDKTFTVQTTEDILAENSEDFTVTISNPTGGGGPTPSLGTTSSVTTTIRDNDALILSPSIPSIDIRLTVDPDSVNESDGETTFTVTATHNDGNTRSEDAEITLSLGGTADSSDYTGPAQASVTIPANSSSGTGTLILTLVDDNVSEGDETIIVGGSFEDLTIGSALITISDNESTYLSIAGPAADVQEGSNATFTVNISKSVASDVTVAWSATAGTAETSDYGTASGSVTFAANSGAGATRTITIPVTNDNLSEGSETFSVELGADTGDEADSVWVKTTASSATATIAESDPITVAISGTSSSVDEGDAVTYTVSISGGVPSADLTVDYATSDGTATAGSDYTAASGTLTFTQASHGDQMVDVQTIEGIIAEPSEDFTFTISNLQGGGSTSLGTSSVTTTIDDDDSTSAPIENRPGSGGDVDVWLTVTPTSVGEDDGTVNFTVTATHDAGTPQTEDVVIALTLGGTADDSDYTAPASASVTIPANQSSGNSTLALTLIDDDLSEGDETIFVGGHLAGTDIASALITINDDDSPYLSIAGPSAEVAEGSNATFTVTLSKSVPAAVTVAWSATAGTAKTSDYGTASGSVTFAANSVAGATQTFTVAVTNDSLSEGSETFSVALGADTGDEAASVWVKTTAASAEATIAESDQITVSISGPSTVDEGDTTTTYTVSLSGGTPTSDLTVSYATANGSAMAGSDYTSASGTLTFTQAAPGSQTFTVQTTGDDIDENDETFTVTISNPSGGGGATSLGTATVSTTINDDDDAPSGITLSVNPTSVDENGSAVEVTVTATLSGGTTLISNTTVTTSIGGTASSSDYSATTLGSISIKAGQSSGSETFTVTPTNDSIVEGDETIVVSGTHSGSLTVGTATFTINDDDNAELSISGPTSNISEGNNASFTVTLSKEVAKEVTVAWSVSPGTASASDYGTASGTVTFSADSAANSTQTFTVAIIDDALSEGTETFSVSLGTANSASATIDASDPITVDISGPSSVDEGDTTTVYTVSLTGGTPTADLTVDYATSDGTATAGSDYTSKSGTLTFTSTAAGAQTFTVVTTEDTVDESGETYTVTISSPSGGGGSTPTLGTATVTTTITDDDGTPSPPSPPSTPSPPNNPINVDPAVLSITGPSGSVDEGFNATFTVTLSKSVATDVTVAWSATTGTAGSSDYSPDSGRVTFPAGSSAGASRTITVAVTNDLLSETSESFTVTLGTITTSSQVSVDASAGSATATIAASDPITVTLSGPSAVNEGDTAAYTVSLSPRGVIPTEGLTVSYATADGTATAGSDYTAASGILTFTATSAGPQTFTVRTTHDSTNEGTGEAFSVAISSPSGGGGPALSLATSSVTTTITDDDTSENPNPTPPQPPPGPTPEPTPTPESTPNPGDTSGTSPELTPTPDPGDTPGSGSGDPLGLGSGDASGQVSETTSVQASGTTPERASGAAPGQASGTTPGQASGAARGQASRTTPGIVSTPSPPTTAETSVLSLSWLSTLPWWLMLLIAVAITVARKRAIYVLRQSPALLGRLWSLLIGVVYGRGG